MHKTSSKKILIAAGGTGGHLFPAQALAEQLLKRNTDFELFFAGAKLSTNIYFDKEKFRFYDIASTTPFRGNLLTALRSIAILIKGITESFRLFSKEKPDLVVGFGSFHVFPLLCVAVIMRTPIVLFESNAIPGKVVRLFSKKAKLTGVYFSDARNYLKGCTVDVEIPVKLATAVPISKQQARKQLNLDPDKMTLLVFGGSQGARGINKNILEVLPLLKKENLSLQLIHLTGCEETVAKVTQLCNQLGISCCVKKFETQMAIAWGAADAVICRAGAMTLAELLHHEVPGILIPYPAASDQHQLKNALFLEKTVGGAVHLIESAITPGLLSKTVLEFAEPLSSKCSAMKLAIKNYKIQQKRDDLCELISRLITNE